MSTSKYFECNIDPNIPKYYHPAIYQKLVDTVALIHERTSKLNMALDDCVLKGCKTRGATFQRIAKVIFNFSNEKFDEMTPAELAEAVDILYDGHDAEERIEWPNAVVAFDTAFVTTKDWEALRHIGIGGSDSSVLMGVNPYQTEEGLWYEKLGYPEMVSEEGKQAIFDRGHFLEDKVIETFCRLVGAHRIPESRMFRSKDYPNTTANIDGILRMPSGALAIFEAKTAARGKEGEWMGSKIPPNYVTQCHQYMAVLNDDRIEGTYIGMIPVADMTLDGTYIASAYNEDFFHHFIERDKDYEEEILENEKAFWDTYVVNGVKPDKSLDPALDKQTMVRYTPTPLSDPTIPTQELSYDQWEPQLEALIEAEKNYSAKKAELDKLEQLRDAARLEVIESMNGAQCAVYKDATGASVITIKNTAIAKTTVDMKLLKQFHKEAFEATKKESAYTRFSYKVN